MKKLLISTLIIIIFTTILLIISHPAYYPEKILIQVFTPEKKLELNATCKADFFDNGVKKIDDRYLINLHNGYYQLDTTELKYYKNYEIRIVCILPKNRGVGGIIINKTNIPCEVKDNYIVCPV